MKEYLVNLLRSNPTPVQGRNLIREYLLARCLESLQRSGAMIPLAFLGGTALRFLFGIPRFSEDLDFSLERTEHGYDFRHYLKNIQSEFLAEGYNVQTKINDQKTVHSAFVRFYGLLYDLHFSAQRDESLSIKIEVDTSPPTGAGLQTTLVRRHVTLRLQHHDQASLFSGKLPAIFQRGYAKGRDLYDLMWYLSDPDWPQPNFTLLRNALSQTNWQGTMPTSENWQNMIYDRLVALDWKSVQADVTPFLERSGDLDLLTLENLARLLKQLTRMK
jgi:predicted nucleotidyltransferase component of viral defense system